MGGRSRAGRVAGRSGRRSDRRVGLRLGCVLCGLLAPAVVLAAAGDLDPGFGTGGVVKIVTAGFSFGGEGRGVALQRDGRILVAVRLSTTSGPFRELAVRRFLPNGERDVSFGEAGLAGLSLPDTQEAWAVAVQMDGKIVVAGEGMLTGTSQFVVARFTSEGQPDATFGPSKEGYIEFGFFFLQRAGARAIAIQLDGKIVLAGQAHDGTNLDFALALLTPDGLLDLSFGNSVPPDGRITTDFGLNRHDAARAVALQKDGRIVAAGFTDAVADEFTSDPHVLGTPTPRDVALARFLADGRLDPSFDDDGLVATDIGSEDTANGLAIQKDGRIVVAGTDDSDFILARYKKNGALDPTFDGDGRVVTDFGSGPARAAAVALQKDGKIVAAGEAIRGTSLDLAVARYQKNGSPDPRFGIEGRRTTHVGDVDRALALALQKDGKIVLAGYSSLTNPALVVARHLGR